MTPLILAVDGDRRQSTQVVALVKDTLDAELIQADTASEGIKALGGRVPDLILTSALLSPKDDGLIAGHLRQLGRAAAHVQTLTIPMLRKGAQKKAKAQRGMLAALRRERPQGPGTEGCDPEVFAEQVRLYLSTAVEHRRQASEFQGPAAIAPPDVAVPLADTPEPEDAVPAHDAADARPWDRLTGVSWSGTGASFESTSADPEPAERPAAAWAVPAWLDPEPEPEAVAPSWPEAGTLVPPPVEVLANEPCLDEADAPADARPMPDAAIELPGAEVQACATDIAEPTVAFAPIDATPAAGVEPETAGDEWAPEASSADMDREPPTSDARDIPMAALEALFGTSAWEGTPSALAPALDAAPTTGEADTAPVLPNDQAPCGSPGEVGAAAASSDDWLPDAASTVERALEARGNEASIEGAAITDVVTSTSPLAPADDGMAEEDTRGDAGAQAPDRPTDETVAVSDVPPPFAPARGGFDDFYVQTPAAEAWAALTTQPLSALTRPEEQSEVRVPMIDMGSCEDLDLLASGLAATTDDPMASLFVSPASSVRAAGEPAWLDEDVRTAEPEPIVAPEPVTMIEAGATSTPLVAPAPAATVEPDMPSESDVAEPVTDVALPIEAASMVEPDIIEAIPEAPAPIVETCTASAGTFDTDAAPPEAAPLPEADVEVAIDLDSYEPPADPVLERFGSAVTEAPPVIEPVAAAVTVVTPFAEAVPVEPVAADTAPPAAAAATEADAINAAPPAVPTPPGLDDDSVAESVVPLLYQAFADELDAEWRDSNAPGEPPPPRAAAEPQVLERRVVLEPELVVEPDVLDEVDELLGAAWLAGDGDVAAPEPAGERADALPIESDAPAASLAEFLSDEPGPVPEPPATHGAEASNLPPWSLPVLDAEALAMIGDAAARALDAAVLRDFELALAEYDESGTDWRDDDARITADATAANGPANAAPDAESAAAPAPASAHARPSVEWGVIDPPHAGLASLLERHDRHPERPEPAPAPRTKAPVAVR